jgi:hypothetical protein
VNASVLDQESVDALEAVETSVVVYFRHVYLPPVGAPDPFRVRPESGRWATAWTLYTADTEYVAWSEYCRQQAADVERGDPTGGMGINARNLPALASVEVGTPLPLRSLFTLTFQFARLADLTTEDARLRLNAAGFSDVNFYADDYGLCPDLAKLGESLGWEALRAPSPAWRPEGRCIAVFEAGRSRLQRSRMVVEAARPTVAVAAGTTYRAGERPGWLGDLP